jgi:cytochrome c oxidase subunit 2
MNRIARGSVIFFLISFFAEVLIAGPGLPPQRFTIVAKRFSFHPDHITVQKGRPVILDLHSEDVTHGLKVKEFRIDVEIHKGRTTEVKFTPEETGHFVGRCSHFCGVGHGSMTFLINVVDR